MPRPRLPIDRLPEPHVFQMMSEIYERRSAEVTAGRHVIETEDFLSKFISLDERQWRRWVNGESFMKRDSFDPLIASLYPTPIEQARLQDKYLEYEFGVRGASRTKRSDHSRRRIQPYEREFFERFLAEKGIAVSDLKDRFVFGRVAKELLDYRSREDGLMFGVHAGEVLALLIRNGTVPSSGTIESERQLAVVMYYAALNADHEDNEHAHKLLMKQMETQFGPLRDDPFLLYMRTSFPNIFYGQYDRIWRPVGPESRSRLRALVRSYEESLGYAVAFDASDNPIQDFGITNLVSSADYNAQRTKAFVDDIDRKRLIEQLETIDAKDLDAGSPVHMRMHNVLGLADAYIRGNQSAQAQELLTDLIDRATVSRQFSRFQLARAHYKRALAAYLSATDLPPSVSEKILSKAIDDLTVAKKIYGPVGNEILESDVMRRIAMILELRAKG
ncbi:hypothetical protein [Bradyrhizobium sp. dw_411]|uniref:hypothetical protein n=1 Tax=Bradyrhizobium sp. dw_411 TaxID=2720082 RepID=UPI001BD195AB|nr:hypothetical protein [Bradyrhizobium sp. dw_411]